MNSHFVSVHLVRRDGQKGMPLAKRFGMTGAAIGAGAGRHRAGYLRKRNLALVPRQRNDADDLLGPIECFLQLGRGHP
jgi:hypothetical protein